MAYAIATTLIVIVTKPSNQNTVKPRPYDDEPILSSEGSNPVEAAPATNAIDTKNRTVTQKLIFKTILDSIVAQY